jgi:hypothetical protein
MNKTITYGSVEKVEYDFGKDEIIEAVRRTGDIPYKEAWEISEEWLYDENEVIIGLKIIERKVKMDAGKEGE